MERYFIEVKSGEATLDDRQKMTLELAKAEGYIPLIIQVRRMDLERNSFDVVVEEPRIEKKDEAIPRIIGNTASIVRKPERVEH
jgi:hypothetical protein